MKTVQLSEDLHKKIKLMALEEGASIPQVIARAIEEEKCKNTESGEGSSPPQLQEGICGMVDGKWIDFPVITRNLNRHMCKHPNIDWNGIAKYARRKPNLTVEDAMIVKLAEVEPSMAGWAKPIMKRYPQLREHVSIF